MDNIRHSIFREFLDLSRETLASIMRNLSIDDANLINTVISTGNAEIAALKAEIAELKTPDAYINNKERFLWHWINGAMECYEREQIGILTPIKYLPEIYAIRSWNGSANEVHTFTTPTKAEAFADSLKGER